MDKATYLLYRDKKGKKDSKPKGIVLGYLLPQEILDALGGKIEKINTDANAGEFFWIEELPRHLHMFEDPDFIHSLSIAGRNVDPTLQFREKLDELRKGWNERYLAYESGYKIAGFWSVMTGQAYPPGHYWFHDVEKMQKSKEFIKTIPQDSDRYIHDKYGVVIRDKMRDYVLGLFQLREYWLSSYGGNHGISEKDLLRYFFRCLAWARNDGSMEKVDLALEDPCWTGNLWDECYYWIDELKDSGLIQPRQHNELQEMSLEDIQKLEQNGVEGITHEDVPVTYYYMTSEGKERLKFSEMQVAGCKPSKLSAKAKRFYELHLDCNLTWPKIELIANDEFPLSRLKDENSEPDNRASVAVPRFAKRYGLPFIPRAHGRKPKK